MPATPGVYLKACINGARTPDQHPHLPVTPEQLAAEAAASSPAPVLLHGLDGSCWAVELLSR